MAGQPTGDGPRKRVTPDPNPDGDANPERRKALAKLRCYAMAGYVAPAFLTLMVSRKASAASGLPPPPPPPP